jgi:type IV pilus assembly protein PilB
VIESGSKQPLIIQLLQERRRFAALAAQGFPEILTPAVLRACEREEMDRRATGARALPLWKILLKKQLLTEKQVEDVRRQAKTGAEAIVPPKEMEAVRKAQAEAGSCWERVLPKLNLAAASEIAAAYAEFLHLPLAKVVTSHFGEAAIARFGKRGVTDLVIRECLELQEKIQTTGGQVPQLGALLIERKLVTEADVQELLKDQEELTKHEGDLILNEDDARLLPEKFCREKMLVAVGRERHSVCVAVVDPTNPLLQEELQHMAGLPVVLAVGTHAAVMGTLDRIYGARDVVREIAKEDQYDSGATPSDDEQVLDLQEQVPPGVDGRIIRLANTILLGAIGQRASDIHLEPFESDVRVRYRVDGELIEITPPPKSMFVPLISRFKILSKMDIAEKRIAQDGAFGAKSGEIRLDFRVNTVPTVYGEKMVMRLLSRGGAGTDMGKLGFTKEQTEHFSKAIQAPHGLVFVTGPTGSGKSTTLYAALAQLNDPSTNITTVEDPVEYKMAGINQVQVKSQVGLTFATALRAFLRQDPDVLMVGEVRDRETAEICMRAALTGHLVLSTLHTNDSLAAVPRLIDMGIEPFLLSSSLRMVEAQRLVRRLCTKCKEPYHLDQETATRVGLPVGQLVYRPKGCDGCRNTGYKGRVGLFEVVPITPEIQHGIQTRAPLQALRDTAKKCGLQLLRDAGMIKVQEGLTSLEEVLAITLAED